LPSQNIFLPEPKFEHHAKSYDYAACVCFELCEILCPVLETFHDLMIKITYAPHIHANSHTGSCAKTSYPSTHQSNKTPIDVTLSNCLRKKMWAMQKEEKEKK
jgi:hypothetical protein